MSSKKQAQKGKSTRTSTTTTGVSASQPSTSKEPHGTQPPSSQPVSDSPVYTSTTATKTQLSTLPTAPSPVKAERTLIAYVQQLSKPQRNKRNTMDYAKLLLQTSNDTSQEALLYSRAKRRILENSETSRTPIKIQRFTFTDDAKKIIINDMTKLSVPDQSEYCFQFKELIPWPRVSIEQNCQLLQ